MPIAQIRQLRPKEFKSLAQVTQLTNGRVGTPSQASGSPLCSVLGDILSPCGNTIRGLSNSTASSEGLVKNAGSDAMDLGRGLRAHTHNYTAGGP